MAFIQIPHDMTELRIMMEQLKEMGKEANEDQLIEQAVVDNAQQLLDEALDGHYFTCKLEDGKLVVYDVINLPTGSIEPLGKNFKEDFITDADNLWIHLSSNLNRIAGGR
ncbi:hypothetical protein AAHB41_02320 [Pediococcus pentosaceus]|jgi:hypothetical protein|uniref:Uncharacterized protein n=3 Tax=Pediococcus pentosaceus TaxID=1255 RepID=A0A1Y0VQK8_PEDPE|nr:MULTISPECIES: hypothetical protein [Pediococcus]ABJ67407.1 hypothetical protein PEPE_0310 [Pediococcus pentosaceus ATCC 25745]ANI98432.1 hypothetical protein AN278_008085 [Pediococcus pentosaceus]ARW20422.1 hypothetical protein S100892_01879 [Pediococcus pentosaceus]ASC09034.1 hypothetical protein S100194_01524 [Pediococcus pentosaceus]AVL02533.1 hypothetical protein PP40703_06810 [Pediococcus pentosaceus]